MFNRLVGFTGTPAMILKFVIIGLVDLVGGIAISAAFRGDAVVIGLVLVAVVLFLNWVYIFRAPNFLKFMAPGIIFLLAFVVVPIVYTVLMSGYKYQSGNVITKDEALTQVIIRGTVPDAEGTAWDITIGTGPDGKYEALMHSQIDGSYSRATDAGVTPLTQGSYQVDENGVPVSAADFNPLTTKQIEALGDKIQEIHWPLPDGSFIAPQYESLAVKMTTDLTYDSKTDTVTSKSSGATYKDNGTGNYANTADPTDVLSPGWRTPNFPENFTGLFTKPELREPFFSVFLWTVMFAFLSVFTTFIVGLLLALAMDKPFRGRAFYRSVLILPYAIPSFMSILVWRVMFDRDFGIINRLLEGWGIIGGPIGWFDSTWTARLVVIVVNLWLGFPYMYLITSGALQAIPSDLKEAAAIDGANAWQAFQKVTLPLLLQILFPLLISSFAFNFNNFNIIYLLTGGLPRDVLAGERAGGTDILISYAYQTAISDPSQQDFGLASAISMFMFVIVALLTMWSLRRTKALEEF